ncbi:MAG: hypothetical protein ABI675_00010 [Chitinophagaceae bacterium]
MLFTHNISSESFKVWIWKDAENKLLLKFSVLAMVISFAWLKILYPYPNFMPPDSNSYLEAAFSNQLINLWPIGYSKFVRLVSCFTNSHFILVSLQYLLLQASLLYFLFSIRYWLSPGKWGFRVLFAVSILNPLLVHIANFVSSDALFTTLSVVWFTQLLWIICQPTKKIFYWHAVIILLAFIVRFTALYYPFISIAVILFCPANRSVKLRGVALIVLSIGIFVGSTAHEYKIRTNTVQFSAFGGWQIGSNALYAYAHAKPIPVEKVPAKFRRLHAIVNKHMESLKKVPEVLRPDYEVAVYYLWDFKSPLRIYMSQLYPKVSDEQFFYKWATLAPLYASYGHFLIKQYPKEYINYYLWPNFLKYYAPPAKFMSAYNMKSETVEPIVVNWFGWKNNKLPTYFKNKEIQITAPFPILFATINILFVLGFLSFVMLGGYKNCTNHCKRILWITLFVWFVNMAFSVFTAPIELRYQIFPMIFTLGVSWLLMSYTIIQTRNESDKKFILENSIPNTAI